MKQRLILILFAFLAAGCGPKIPLLGMNDSGDDVEKQVSASGYSNDVGGYLSSVNDSAVPALSQTNSTPNWSVRTVTVGLIVSGNIGIGSYKVGAMGRFRVLFSNAADPAVP